VQVIAWPNQDLPAEHVGGTSYIYVVVTAATLRISIVVIKARMQLVDQAPEGVDLVDQS